MQPCKTYQTRKYLIRKSKTLDILQIQMVSRILHRGLETLLTQCFTSLMMLSVMVKNSILEKY